MATIRERIAEAQRTDRSQVEDSVLPRAATVAAVVVALLAVGVTGAAPLGEVALSIPLVIIGNVLSHERRHADNRWIKAAIAAIVLLVLARFFTDVGQSQTIDDTRLPLTSLFLGVQTLHAFDLPRTRDLTFTVSASMALIALASASARSGFFPLLMGLWLLLAGLSLWLLRLGANRRRGGHTLAREHLVAPGSGLASVSRTRPSSIAAVVLATLVLFLAMPRSEVGQTVALPFEQFRQGIPSPGGVTNPGLPVNPGTSSDPNANFDATAYFGLADTVDIRTVGQLGDQLVLRVRSSRPRLLRGMVFDTYADNRWTRTAEEPGVRNGLPVRLERQPGPRTNLTQIIEVVTPTPNLVFSAAAPLDLYHAGQSAQQWDDGTVTVATTQEEGTVYSVIASVPIASEASMRAAIGPTPPEIVATWLQVPDLSDRTRRLSAELVDPRRSNYENAESVMAWMADNVAYSLDLDDHPPDQDAIDTLLFERQLGWCEPISSSMVMLLREGGVPARWVTGFMPGDFNVLSGFWEVRAKHAHAWVEVWIPEHGWIAFDPTGAVPNADGPATASVSIPLLALFDQFGAWLRSLSLLGRALLVGTLAALVGTVVHLRRRVVASAPLDHLPIAWEPWETPTDLADRLARDHDAPPGQLGVLVGAHHAQQLGTDPPAGDEVRAARAAVRRSIRRGRPQSGR